MVSKKSIFWLILCVLNAAFATRDNHKHHKRIKKETPVSVHVVNNEVTDAEYVFHCHENDRCTRVTSFTIKTPLTLTCLHKFLEIRYEAFEDNNSSNKVEKVGYLSQHPFHPISDYQELNSDCQKIKRYGIIKKYLTQFHFKIIKNLFLFKKLSCERDFSHSDL